MEVSGADARGRILAAISARPGIHMRELERTVGISLTGIGHHLRALEKQGLVVGISDRHYRRYFLSTLVLPSEARRLSQDDRRLLSECQRRSSLAIILSLAVDGTTTARELERRLHRARRSADYHLARLVKAGFVRSSSGASGPTYDLVDPKRVVSVLVTFAATLQDTTDGFARLWQALRD